MALFGNSYDTIEKARAAREKIRRASRNDTERLRDQAAQSNNNDKLFRCALSENPELRKLAIPKIDNPKALHMLVLVSEDDERQGWLTRRLCALNEHLALEDLMRVMSSPDARTIPAELVERFSSRDDLMTLANDATSANLRTAALHTCIVHWPSDVVETVLRFAKDREADLPQLFDSWPTDAAILENALAEVDDPDTLGALSHFLDGHACLASAQRLMECWPGKAMEYLPQLVAHAIGNADFALAVDLKNLIPADELPCDFDRIVVSAVCTTGDKDISPEQEKSLIELLESIESQDLLVKVIMDSSLTRRYFELPGFGINTPEHRVIESVAKRLDNERLYSLITINGFRSKHFHRYTREIQDAALVQLREREYGPEMIAEIIDLDPKGYSYPLTLHIFDEQLMRDLAEKHPKNSCIKDALRKITLSEGDA